MIDAPRGFDLEWVGNPVRRLPGVGAPMVYLQRHNTAFSDAAAVRAFSPSNSVQLCRAMAH